MVLHWKGVELEKSGFEVGAQEKGIVLFKLNPNILRRYRDMTFLGEH
jgi:hypothetical protein